MSARLSSFVSFVGFDLLGSLPRFPWWWYGTGWLKVIHWSGEGLRYRWRKYGLGLWLRNVFVPMYGISDWTGRLISFLVRLFVVLVRLIAWIVEAVAYGMVLLLWLVAPLGFLFLFIRSLVL